MHGAQNTCLNARILSAKNAHAVLKTPVWMHAYSPLKMHMHPCMCAYATVQKLSCHGNYCELILSLVRTSCRFSFAARPAAFLTKLVTRRCSLKHWKRSHGAHPFKNCIFAVFRASFSRIFFVQKELESLEILRTDEPKQVPKKWPTETFKVHIRYL